jgi:hypothetical protein
MLKNYLHNRLKLITFVKMKKLIFVLVLLSLLSCKKQESEPSKGTLTFYHITSSHWSLIIDGVNYGKIQNLNFIPDCGNINFQCIDLNEGTYIVYAKNLDGYASGNEKEIFVEKDKCKVIKMP